MGKPTQVERFPLDLLTEATCLNGLVTGFHILQKQILATCESVAITNEDRFAVSVEGKEEGHLVVTKVNEDLAQDYPLFFQDDPQADPSAMPVGDNGKHPEAAKPTVHPLPKPRAHPKAKPKGSRKGKPTGTGKAS